MAQNICCDKCKKIINRADNFGLTISDNCKLLSNSKQYQCFDLCSECSGPLADYLNKLFLIKP